MENKRSIGISITEGVIYKQILGLFFPIIIGTFFQQLYNTVDMIVVGRFVGTEALSAVGGSSAQIVSLVVGFFTGLAAGCGVIISQAFGGGDMKKVREGIQTAYCFSLIGGVTIGLLGFLVSKSLLILMNTPPDTLLQATLYLRIYFSGLVFVFVFNIGSGILRALGNTRLPLYYLIVCSVLNILLDLLLVLAFNMGVAGVALATLLAQAVSASLVTWTLTNSESSISLDIRHLRINGHLLLQQLKLGLPSGLTSVMYAVSNMIVQTSVNSYGTVVTAALGADGKIEAFFWMVNNAFGVSLTTFVGQNYGAERWDRIRKGTRICLLMYALVAAFIAVVFFAFAGPLFTIFTADKAVIETGIMILRICAPFYVVFTFVEIYSATLRGIGNVFIPMLMTMCGVCFVRIAWILFLLPIFPSMEMIVWVYPVTWAITSMAYLIYYSVYSKRHFPA